MADETAAIYGEALGSLGATGPIRDAGGETEAAGARATAATAGPARGDAR
jgi:hypothetical protein